MTPTDEAGMLQAVQQHGPAPGAKKMMQREAEAAQMAMDTGLYGAKTLHCHLLSPLFVTVDSQLRHLEMHFGGTPWARVYTFGAKFFMLLRTRPQAPRYLKWENWM